MGVSKGDKAMSRPLLFVRITKSISLSSPISWHELASSSAEFLVEHSSIEDV